MKYRPLPHIVTEAVVIGVLNFVIFTLINRTSKLSMMMKLFLSGVLIHILFEVLGGNEWWCRSTYK